MNQQTLPVHGAVVMRSWRLGGETLHEDELDCLESHTLHVSHPFASDARLMCRWVEAVYAG